ncbi:hypothetical protein V5O48_011982 [Marasmius crinis-equi]|uniref:Protein-S-isoprenylcysteine O-methyltransferase n=1 Tax=Marasmius crinis-equi TaxID=585013 RepID=A0ABR3F4F6_9AGAR
MSLLKVPLLLLNAGSLLVPLAVSSPPPPVLEVRYSRRKSERFLLAVLPGVMMLTPLIFVVETFIILLSQFRGPPRRLASLLMLSGPTDALSTSPAFLIGTTLILMASILRWACHERLGRLYTPALTIRKNHKLITEGPYAIVRHPGYASWLIMEVGLLVVFSAGNSWLGESGVLESALGRLVAGAWLAVCVVGDTVLVAKRVPREEGLLKKEFGKEWSEYRKRVPWRLIPGVY